MISQKYRFHGHASLKYLLSHGTIARGRELSIKFVDNKRRRYSRVAIIVSKKVLRHATERNRARRRLYEIMRTRIPKFNRTIDLAIIVYRADVLTMSHVELVRSVDKCLTKLGVIDTNGSQDATTGDRI